VPCGGSSLTLHFVKNLELGRLLVKDVVEFEGRGAAVFHCSHVLALWGTMRAQSLNSLTTRTLARGTSRVSTQFSTSFSSATFGLTRIMTWILSGSPSSASCSHEGGIFSKQNKPEECMSFNSDNK